MKSRGRVHDRAILDALEAIRHTPYEGNVWRVTRKGRDAVRGSSADGRWCPPGEFEVLNTSLKPEGALAEIGYRLSLEPVWPSRIEHEIHLIELLLERTLNLADLSQLSNFGVDVTKYKSFDYLAAQALASAAHFLEFDGLIVPSARYECSNLIVFIDRIGLNVRLEVRETKPVDWQGWQKNQD